MNDAHKQSLSALIDNEVDEVELRRVIKAVATDEELADCWQRYNLAQAVLHGKSAVKVSAQLSHNIARAIDQEQVSFVAGWRQQAGKFAIAASVAVLVFAGLQSSLRPTPVNSPVNVQSASVEIAPRDTAAEKPISTAVNSLAATEPVAVDPVARQRLEEYINQASITHEPPTQLEYIQDSPLYRLVNEVSLPPATGQR